MSTALSESSIEKISSMLCNDTDSVHFLWDCRAHSVETLGGCLCFPEDTQDPFDYILGCGLIEERSVSFFHVFSSRLNEAIINGIPDSTVTAVVNMKLSEKDDFRLCNVSASLLKDENGLATDIYINIRPFTQKQMFEHEILKHFTADKNPALFSRRCFELVKRADEGKVAFIQFDVERFKLINEMYGTRTGDEVIQFFSDSLNVICSEDQPHCHLTADIFMVVTEFEDREQLIDFIHTIESRLSFYNGMEYRLIFGICIVEKKDPTARRYGDYAGLARNAIKGNALRNINFFTGELIADLQKKQDIEENMYKAVVNGEFVMYLQPKYSISENRIIGAEALARWIHPERGMIPPADFIPIFEQNGFIIKLDKIIWESACRSIRRLIDRGIEPVPISVNVSREYMANTDVLDIISGLVEKYDIPIQMLELEITETIDNPNIQDTVKKFKEAGFTILMDDFGTGYSSLNTLKTTPFDVLKIDRSFFTEFMESDRGRKIISHTISMSQDIGLDIIAEGVETAEQAEFLSVCGCDSAQGYLYCRPVPAEEFEEMLAL